MIEAILLLIAILGVFAVHYFAKKNNKTQEYIWVGPGENPFKR